jgi:hypothetical protein
MKQHPLPPSRIPAWVNWIAQDAGGTWWGYSVEPLRHETGWYENELGRYAALGRTDPLNWQQSLRKIETRGA